MCKGSRDVRIELAADDAQLDESIGESKNGLAEFVRPGGRGTGERGAHGRERYVAEKTAFEPLRSKLPHISLLSHWAIRGSHPAIC